jgi:HSP20 family protein
MVSLIRHGGSPLAARRTSAPIARIDPWNDFTAMDRLFDAFWRTPIATPGREAADASIELYETKDELLAFVTAPGIAPDTFDISVEAETITITGERKPLLEAAEGLVSHTPWLGTATSASTFRASYTLPVEIDPDKAQAAYKDGILQIRMPKTEAAKPKQVKVEVGQ